jgi:opacity protein-like surface antigen
MLKIGLIVGLVLFGQSTALAQEEAPVSAMTEPTARAGAAFASTTARSSANNLQIGVAFLPMLLGKVATGPSGSDTSSNLDFAYGVGLSFGYSVLAGLSVGIAPQAIFHLGSKDSAGYRVIDSEKEYDLMARIAYAYTVVPRLDVYAEVLPGYSFVTYSEIIQGSQAPKAHGVVLGGGLGAAFAITERLFANVGVGYQQGFQVSHGIGDRDVKTKFVRVALGGGVKF